VTELLLAACLACGAELVQAKTGRRRRYCSDACRQRARRERVTKCGDGLEVVPTPRVARERLGVRSFATFSELDAWLMEN
jgi:hypothetical protein